MHVLKQKYFEQENRILKITILLSIVVHFLFLFLLKSEFFKIDPKQVLEKSPEPVTFFFPENRPRQIVENINANNQTPENSDLLSDYNSQARNPDLLDNTANQPFSDGSLPFENLSNPQLPLISRAQAVKKFSRDALSNDPTHLSRENFFQPKDIEEMTDQNPGNENFSPDRYAQKKFSADQMGDLSLSTYAWEWAPYVNALRRKLYQVWYAPVAYYRLGLIFGHTVIQFSISRDGNLIEYKVLEQNGHESLEQSSVNAIVALFPFKSLPRNFPEDHLTITARLIYPNLREVNR
jgi:hypothetical protein